MILELKDLMSLSWSLKFLNGRKCNSYVHFRKVQMIFKIYDLISTISERDCDEGWTEGALKQNNKGHSAVMYTPWFAMYPCLWAQVLYHCPLQRVGKANRTLSTIGLMISLRAQTSTTPLGTIFPWEKLRDFLNKTLERNEPRCQWYEKDGPDLTFN